MNETTEFSIESYSEYLKSGYKRNFVANVLDSGTYVFGLNVASPEVIVPALLIHLGASNLLIAMIPVITMLGMTLPNIFLAGYTEGLPRVYGFITRFAKLQRLPWILFPFILPFTAEAHPQLTVWIYTGFAVFSWCMCGCVRPAWTELIAKNTPPWKLGKLFSQMNLMASFSTLAGGFVVRELMASPSLSFPLNYTVIFAVSGTFITLSYLFFSMNREQMNRPAHEYRQRTVREYLSGLPVEFKTDRRLQQLTLARILAQSNVIAFAFLMKYALTVAGAPNHATGDFLLYCICGAVAISLAFNFFSDRIGMRLCMILTSIACMLALLLPLWNMSMLSLSAAFVFLGMAKFGYQICNEAIVIRNSPHDKRPTHTAVVNFIAAPFLVIYAVGGSYMVDTIGYTVPFYLAAVFNLLAIVVLYCISERSAEA